jgi:hypothetical protein
MTPPTSARADHAAELAEPAHRLDRADEVAGQRLGGVDGSLSEAVELFLDRRDAERVVEDWER